jgi:AAA+ ATPase superfamily predicted ATPase
MLFDLRSKERLEELFGRDEEVDKCLELLTLGNWVTVLGPRMVGKTSLIKVILSELERHRRKKKYEGIYASLFGVKSLPQLLEALTHALNSKRGLVARVRRLLDNVSGFHVGPDGITVETKAKPMNTLSELLAALGRSPKDSHYVIALDEVQELAPVSGHLLKLLGNVFNTYRNITMIFSGSTVGIIKTLLEPESTSPLYGRPPAKIMLRPFGPEESSNFLSAGFKECKATLSQERIAEIVGKLDGITGWLTLFGNNYGVRKMGYSEAVGQTIKDGKKIVRSELDHFVEGRQKETYLAVLRTLKTAGNFGYSWSQLKSGAEILSRRPINNQTLANTIEALKSVQIFELVGEGYRIVDPLMREAI